MLRTNARSYSKQKLVHQRRSPHRLRLAIAAATVGVPRQLDHPPMALISSVPP